MLDALVPSFVKRRYAARLAVVLLVAVALFSAVGYTNVTTVSGTVDEISGAVDRVNDTVDRVSETVEKNAERQLTATARLQAQSIGTWIDTQRSLVRSTSAAGQVASGDALSEYLAAQVDRNSGTVRVIHVIDLTNRSILYSSDAGAVGTSPSAPWSSAPLSVTDPSEVWVSSASYEGPEGDAVLAFASRSPARPDRVVVVVSSVEAHANRLYDTVGNQSTSVVNARGSVVTRGENSRLTGTQSGEGGITVNNTAMIAAGEGRTTFVTESGRAFAYAPVSETDSMVQANELYRRWVVVTSLPTEQAFEAANQAQLAADQTREAATQARSTASTVTGSVVGLVVVALLTLGGFGAVVGYQTIRPLSSLRDRAQRMEEGDLDVDLETDREDEIGRLYGSFAAMRDALRERIREAERARKEAESAREEAERSRERVERLNEDLERAADRYSEVMSDCAAGDLTRRMTPESDDESMRAIAEAFNDMLDDLEATLSEVQSFATEVATESQAVTASAQEVRNASQQVTESIQEISDGAAEQDDRLQAVSTEMSSLSTTTEEIASSSNEVASIAEKTAETGREGRAAAQDAADGMGEIRERSAAIVEAVDQLESEMEGIDELTEFIADVAKETNMLALNANIEATRGEGGDDGGFAAVAEQVKEFAEDTREAAEEIEQRLEAIQRQADTTASEVRESDERIAENAADIENAIAALDDVATYAEETNDGIQEISAATEEQSSSVQEVVAMVDEVAEIGERTAVESEKVASAAEEQTAAMDDVSESADDLARRAGELSEVLDRFETGGGDGGGPADVGDVEDDAVGSGGDFGDGDSSPERPGE